MERVLGLIECVKSGLWSFILEFSCWMVLHGWVDSNQIETLIKNSQRYATWKISNMFKKINKVIGENEKSVLFYRRKTKSVFGQPNILYIRVGSVWYGKGRLSPVLNVRQQLCMCMCLCLYFFLILYVWFNIFVCDCKKQLCGFLLIQKDTKKTNPVNPCWNK